MKFRDLHIQDDEHVPQDRWILLPMGRKVVSFLPLASVTKFPPTRGKDYEMCLYSVPFEGPNRPKVEGERMEFCAGRVKSPGSPRVHVAKPLPFEISSGLVGRMFGA